MSEPFVSRRPASERRPLGLTGLAVSPVILGCGSIGGIGTPVVSRGKGLSAVEGLRQIDAAVELGINTLDTAIGYAGGESERVVGQWRAGHPDVDVLITTKVGLPVPDGQPEVYLSAEQIADVAAALTLELDEDARDEISALFDRVDSSAHR